LNAAFARRAGPGAIRKSAYRLGVAYDGTQDELPARRASRRTKRRTTIMAKGQEKKATNNKAKLSVKEKKAKKKERLAKKG
jgi:hypothetical protein